MYRISYKISKDCVKNLSTLEFVTLEIGIITNTLKLCILCVSNNTGIIRTDGKVRTDDGWHNIYTKDRDSAVKVLTLLKETDVYDTRVVKL